jgi:hypothetical protein
MTPTELWWLYDARAPKPEEIKKDIPSWAEVYEALFDE